VVLCTCDTSIFRTAVYIVYETSDDQQFCLICVYVFANQFVSCKELYASFFTYTRVEKRRVDDVCILITFA
jgi:hypothetical protein